MTLSTRIGQLRLLAILEGISYLSLGLTMYLKYYQEMGLPNKIVGMMHGILLIAYCIWVLIVGKKAGWKWETFMVCWVASLLPIGTFWADAKYFKPLEQSNA